MREIHSPTESAGERHQQIRLRDQGERQEQRDERRVQTRWKREEIRDTESKGYVRASESALGVLMLTHWGD